LEPNRPLIRRVPALKEVSVDERFSTENPNSHSPLSVSSGSRELRPAHALNQLGHGPTVEGSDLLQDTAIAHERVYRVTDLPKVALHCVERSNQ
jgi:hypothetical protein